MQETKGTFAIVQLTRFGDLVQTLQAARELKLTYPDIKLKLIARSEFAKPLNFLLKETFDQIILLDKSQLLTESLAESLESYLDNINTFLEDPRLQGIDVLINLSFCETSNYLSRLLTPKYRLGTYIGNFNQVVVSDQWSQLVYSMVMGGPNCPFSLVDIYKSIFGIKERKSWQHEERSVKNPFTLGLHPFASTKKKRWKASKWSEVIYKVLKDSPQVKIKVFGSSSEAEEASQLLSSPSLKRFSSQIENHVGKHNLESTFNQIKECSHFVGHDSLLGHLAKEAGVASITLALGTVRPMETAPYGINTFVVSPKTKCFPCFPEAECNFFQCHADISYQAVAEIVKGFVLQDDIDIEKLKKDVSPFHLDSISIHRYGPTQSGWYASEALTDEPQGIKHIIRDINRISLLYKCEEVEENISFPKIDNSQASQLNHYNQGIEQLYQLAEFGKKYSKDILIEIGKDVPSMEEVRRLGNKIEEVDQLKVLLLKAYPELSPLIDFYKVIKANLQGENIVEIAESSYIVYNDNSVLCSIIYELVNNTIENYNKRSGRPQKTKEGNV